jgi:hypothetical protein
MNVNWLTLARKFWSGEWVRKGSNLEARRRRRRGDDLAPDHGCRRSTGPNTTPLANTTPLGALH